MDWIKHCSHNKNNIKKKNEINSQNNSWNDNDLKLKMVS